MSTKYRIVERSTVAGNKSFHIQERAFFGWKEWYQVYSSKDSAEKAIAEGHTTDKVVKEITYD